MRVVDDYLFLIQSEGLSNGIVVLSGVAMIAWITPPLLILVAGVGIFYIWIQQYYRLAAIELKRMEGKIYLYLQSYQLYLFSFGMFLRWCYLLFKLSRHLPSTASSPRVLLAFQSFALSIGKIDIRSSSESNTYLSYIVEKTNSSSNFATL